jgi:hypothetical protein
METYLFTLARYLPETPVRQFFIQAPTLEAALVSLGGDEEALTYNPRHVQIATWAPAVVTTDGTITNVEKRHLEFDVWSSDVHDGETWVDAALAKVRGTFTEPT